MNPMAMICFRCNGCQTVLYSPIAKVMRCPVCENFVMQMGPALDHPKLPRPVIGYHYCGGNVPVVTHNDVPCRVVMRRDLISVGCTDVTPQAAEFLWTEYNRRFPETPTVQVVQEGGKP